VVSAGIDGIAFIWDPITGTELASFEVPATAAGYDTLHPAVTFRPDGTLVMLFVASGDAGDAGAGELPTKDPEAPDPA
jgi:hypothetical protein